MHGTKPTAETLVQTLDSSWHAVAAGDFDGDGKSDILFQNASGPVDIWLMNGTTPIAETLVQNLDSSWHIRAG